MFAEKFAFCGRSKPRPQTMADSDKVIEALGGWPWNGVEIISPRRACAAVLQ